MPFKSEKQRRYLHANEPEIAQRWEREEDMAHKKDGYYNDRNFPDDTFDRLTEESAMPFVSPDPVMADGTPMISLAEDAAYAATPLDMCVEADGRTTTRAKYGPANESVGGGDGAGTI